ncbi:hypothetical protein NECAME_06591 [Necator americanus]|uniref:Uncharacterized protein n=1 Tax=Necator americanus TaxID=51031 RepID=W2TTR6_NECAM|nr:hypothetical protein NECAME_06591 [Necator americanus]ETN85044.1 hypothetical protein NECAME_06591 [Necator americanus]
MTVFALPVLMTMRHRKDQGVRNELGDQSLAMSDDGKRKDGSPAQRRRREGTPEKKAEEKKSAEEENKEKKEPLDLLRTRTGGAYIPPAKLRMLQDQIQDKAHEVLALEIMILMLETPTDDSVEVSIAFLKECGAKLTEAYPAVIDELDLIDEDDQITHTLSLEDAINPENELNVFKFDPEFEKNEKQYEEIRAEIIGDADDSDEEGSGDEDEASGDEGEEKSGAAAATGTTEIIDNTEQNLVAFRREVYLTIQSSLDFQEAAHKLLKMKVPQELETTFEKIACDTYATIHRFDITKLRNMARLISHLLFTDAISWTIFTDVKLTENDTTSSGRIYLKYIFQELCESMGLAKLYERTNDPLDLRKFLEKGMKKKKQDSMGESPSSSSSTSDDSSDDSSDSDGDSDSDDEDSDSSSSSSSSSSSDSTNARKRLELKKKLQRARLDEGDRNGSDRAQRRIKEEPPSPESSPKREKRKDRERNGKETEVQDKRNERERRRSASPSKTRKGEKSPSRNRRSRSTSRSRKDRNSPSRRRDRSRNENKSPSRGDSEKSRKERDRSSRHRSSSRDKKNREKDERRERARSPESRLSEIRVDERRSRR